MRCSDVLKRSTAYLAGELSCHQASAIRGHIRTCADCNDKLSQEAQIQRAARELPVLEPPPAVWRGIQEKMARAEIKDSRRSRVSRGTLHFAAWLREYKVYLAASACCLVLVFFAFFAGGKIGGDEDRALAISDPTLLIREGSTYEESTAREILAADRHYQETIATLREMLYEQKNNWPEDAYKQVIHELDGFRHQAIAVSLRTTSLGGGLVEARDELYDVYLREIDYLQDAVLRNTAEVGWAEVPR